MLLYTANIGGYDKLQVTPQPGFDFRVYQNKIYELNSVKSARYYKILNLEGYNVHEENNISIWLDSNIKIKCDLKAFVNKWIANVDMVFMEHGRDCIYEEMDACIERKKDTVENIERQRKFYLKRGYPKHAGMVGTGIIIRKLRGYDELDKFLMESWWNEVERFSHRDQFSFNYALWKANGLNMGEPRLKFAYIPYSVFGNEFELVPHEKTHKK